MSISAAECICKYENDKFRKSSVKLKQESASASNAYKMKHLFQLQVRFSRSAFAIYRFRLTKRWNNPGCIKVANIIRVLCCWMYLVAVGNPRPISIPVTRALVIFCSTHISWPPLTVGIIVRYWKEAFLNGTYFSPFRPKYSTLYFYSAICLPVLRRP